MKVTLTLDNGPHPEVTPAALDVLQRHDIASTFFMVGEAIATGSGQELAARARAEGHRIGNHTWSHHRPLGEEPDQELAVLEVARAQEVLANFADADKLYRPYAGKGIFGPQMMSRTVFNYLKQECFSCVTWNCVPRDWEPGWVDRAINSIAEREWSVVVVHDIPRGGTHLLNDFLQRAKGLGAQFTTEFPSECTPLWRGQEQFDFSANISEL